MSGESHVNLFEQLRFILEKVLLNRSSSDTHKTKSMKDRSFKASHLCHLWINMQWVSIVTQSVKSCLTLSCHFFLNHIWLTFGYFWERILDSAFVAKTSDTSNKQTRSYSALKSFSFSFSDLSVKNQYSAFAFVLKIDYFLLDYVFCVMFQRLFNRNCLFSVQQLHWVEWGNTGNIKVSICKRSSMANN